MTGFFKLLLRQNLFVATALVIGLIVLQVQRVSAAFKIGKNLNGRK